ncbi:MAG: sarcosine oxidase subunit gamma [Gemmobacter sp.]
MPEAPIRPLSALTALGSATPRKVVHGALTLEENPGLALASLALRRGTARPAPFGMPLPDAGGWTGRDGMSIFWTAPDQWLVSGEALADSDFAATVAAEAPGSSVTEQTDGFAAFEITASTGEARVLSVLTKLVNLDPRRYGPGTATRTGLEHMSVFVIRPAPGRLTILGMRSAAGSLWHALETAIARAAP